MTTNLPEMTPAGEMPFYGIDHPIYTLLDTQYISMRPLVEQLGLDWQQQKSVLLDDYEIKLFGTLQLEGRSIIQPPSIYYIGSQGLHLETPVKVAVFRGEKVPVDTVFINAKSVFFYIFRIDLDAAEQTKPGAKDEILAIQIEMSDAIHNYEKRGIAVKK